MTTTIPVPASCPDWHDFDEIIASIVRTAELESYGIDSLPVAQKSTLANSPERPVAHATTLLSL
jgi:hypothetical protein